MAQVPFNGKDRKCPICGKTFLLYEETWVYKRRVKGDRTKYFCSYGCMTKFDDSRPKTLASVQREAIIGMIKSGHQTSDIVRTLGVDKSKVRYWQMRIEKEAEEK